MIKGFRRKIRAGLRFAELIIVSTLIALAISLGMIAILELIGFSINAGIPVAIGVISAAIYAARV